MAPLSPRLQTILDRHGAALLAAVQEREPHAVAGQTAEGLVTRLAEADPSANKSATQWLVRTYIAGGFRLEDLGQARDILGWFSRYQRRLPVAERSLHAHPSLRSLWRVVRPLVEADAPASNKELDRRERAIARAESRILIERPNGFTVACPLTERAAKWWGRGTIWCTSADYDNAFATYNAAAPLLVVILADGRKLQLWASPHEAMFNTDHDEPVSRVLVARHWADLAPVLNWAVGENGELLFLVPGTAKTPEMCHRAVNSNSLALASVPLHLLTPELNWMAVEKNGCTLRMVEEDQRTEALCQAAVAQNGVAIGWVPKPFRTPELCLAAVRHNPEALIHIPDTEWTPELCRAALMGNGKLLDVMSYPMRTAELCGVAVRQNGDALCMVPPEFRTAELCREAVTHSLPGLVDASSGEGQLRSAVGIIQFSTALNWVPPGLLTPELCLAAVTRNGLALCHVPMEFRTPALCQAAVRQHPLALWAVPQEHRSREMLLHAVSRYGVLLASVPPALRDEAMCQAAVRQNSQALSDVPEANKTDAVIHAMLGFDRKPGASASMFPPEDKRVVDHAAKLDALAAEVATHDRAPTPGKEALSSLGKRL